MPRAFTSFRVSSQGHQFDRGVYIRYEEVCRGEKGGGGLVLALGISFCSAYGSEYFSKVQLGPLVFGGKNYINRPPTIFAT